MTISSLAFLIARKIGREGWKPKAGTVDIVDSVVTPERIQQMLNNVGAVYLDNFTNTIINYLKQAAL
jgi:hypothetical protein